MKINLQSISNIFSSRFLINSIELFKLNCSSIELKDSSNESINCYVVSSAIIKILKPNSFFIFLDVWKNIEIFCSSVIEGTHKLKTQGALFSNLWSCSLTKFISMLISKNKLHRHTVSANNHMLWWFKSSKNWSFSNQNTKIICSCNRFKSLKYVPNMLLINLKSVSSEW